MKTLCLIFSLALTIACTQDRKSSLSITELSCEYKINPLGIDDRYPRFSWQFSSNENNKMQSAYRILVASEIEILNDNQGDIWDTGKTKSGISTNISFDGKPLISFMSYYWKVMAWDEN